MKNDKKDLNTFFQSEKNEKRNKNKRLKRNRENLREKKRKTYINITFNSFN